MNWRRIAIPVIILLAGFFLMRLLLNSRREPQSRPAAMRSRKVQSMVVQLGEVPSEIISYGRLASSQPVVLFSEVTGVVQAGTVPFQPAQSFRRGDLLLQIDERQARLELHAAKSDLMNALATVLPEIKVDFPEEFPVWQDYFNSCNFKECLQPLPEAANQRIKLYLSRFNVYKLYFQVQNLEIVLEKHRLVAPFAGVIRSADLREGSTVRPGTRLGEIINLEKMEIELPVPAMDAQWIDREKPVRFTSSEIAGEWSGRIDRIGKSIDERTQTLPLFLRIAGKGHSELYDGVFLRAVIPGKFIADAVSIPRQSLVGDRSVYLVRNGRLVLQEVEVARLETDRVIISGNLAAGDTLVMEILQGVSDGLPVQAYFADSQQQGVKE